MGTADKQQLSVFKDWAAANFILIRILMNVILFIGWCFSVVVIARTGLAVGSLWVDVCRYSLTAFYLFIYLFIYRGRGKRNMIRNWRPSISLNRGHSVGRRNINGNRCLNARVSCTIVWHCVPPALIDFPWTLLAP